MNHLIVQRSLLLVGLTVVIACGEAPKNSSEKNTLQEQAEQENKAADKSQIEFEKGADYSSLFNEYQCAMDIAEFAKAIDVPASSVSLPEYQGPDFCSFAITGFGKDKLGQPSTIMFESIETTIDQNRDEIRGALKNQEEYPEQVRVGMGITLSETGDAYIYSQPHVGRVLIYTGYNDNAFLIGYGRKSEVMTDRTQEEHDELTLKMVDLANYLLKKHRR